MCDKPEVPKETPAPGLTNPCPDKPPFKIVFYESGDRDSGSFQAYATDLAESLGALKMPYSGCAIEKVGGAIADVWNGNVLERARKYSICLDRKVEQLHMVGHIWPQGHRTRTPGPSGMSGNINPGQAARFAPHAKLVLHGCDGVGNAATQTAAFLKAVPKSTVYSHFGSAEAGGPLNFHKHEAGAATHTFVKKMVDEGVGFTYAFVEKWAHAHITGIKTKTKEAKGLTALREWFKYDNFNSWECYRFAQLILADPSSIPPDIVQGAANRVAKWNASVAASQQPAPASACPLPVCPTCTQ